MKYVKAMLGLGAMLALTACSDPVEKVVKDNLEGFQKQDITKVLATLDQTSPVYEGTKTEGYRMMQDYTLDYHIESMTVIEKPDDEKKAMEKAKLESEDTTGLDDAIGSFVTEEDKAKAEAKKREQEKANARRPLIAKVKVVQVTRAKGDASNFLDNRITVIHTLHKYPTDAKPEWKIFKSDIRNVEILKES